MGAIDLGSSTQPATDWATFFRLVADHLRGFAAKKWPLEADGSGSPVYLSCHGLFNAFPVPSDVLLLDSDGIVAQRKQGPLATAIRYDFSQPKTPTVRVHGIVPLADVEAHRGVIESVLGISDPLDSLKDLSISFQWDSPFCTHVVPYDPRTRVSDYCDALVGGLSFGSDLTELFSPKVDYSKKYGLPPDPALTDEQLLTVDPLSACFVRMSDGKCLSLSERHDYCANIQLIPQVPESVRRTFHLAKRLFVYGYLEYGFFTISFHYAQLALDAALHARWSADLPSSVVLTGLNKKTRKQESQNMVSPSHVKIRELCKSAKWSAASVKVDGKQFPYTVNLLLAELNERRLITMWQRKMIGEVDVEIRNSLTHLEFAPVHSPAPYSLDLVAETINSLFDSLPLTVSPAPP